jgi:hypothetical protein
MLGITNSIPAFVGSCAPGAVGAGVDVGRTARRPVARAIERPKMMNVVSLDPPDQTIYARRSER